MRPESITTMSVPPPKVTLPSMIPVPPAGSVSWLSPPGSFSPPGDVPLLQTWLSLPAVGVKTHWARAGEACPSAMPATDASRNGFRVDLGGIGHQSFGSVCPPADPVYKVNVAKLLSIESS